MSHTKVPAAEPISLPLDRIVADSRFQVRKRGTDPATVKRYEAAIRQGVTFPPIKVADVDGVLYCVDGFHRREAHMGAGHRIIEAYVEKATPQHAKWLAAACNLSHGLPLKNAELREAFRRYVKARQHEKRSGRLKSYREIAIELGGLKRHTTVRNWMMTDFPATAAKMGGPDTTHAVYTGREVPASERLRQHAEESLHAARNCIAALTGKDRAELEGTLATILDELRSGASWKPQEPDPF